jgi:16S rRNA C1402 (ribose-2'-O) methylase RsmI
MDTPYRLEKLLKEMQALNPTREIFLGMELNKKDEELLRGKLQNIKAPDGKKEFVMVIGGNS